MSSTGSTTTGSITKAQIALFAIFIAAAAFAIDLFLPAIPLLAEDLGVEAGSTGQLLSLFFISFAVGQLIAGPISDRFGRRPLALGGLVLLFVGSVLGMLSDSFEMLLGVRVLQALGICSLTVTARASVTDILGVSGSAKTFALLMLVGGVAPMVAPWLGTAVVNLFGWQGAFGVVVVLAVLLFVMTFFKMPETHVRSKVFKENTLVSYWKLLSNPRVLMYTLAGAFSGGSLFVFIGAAPTIFRSVYEVDQSAFATIFTLHAVCMMVGGQIARTLLNHKKPEEALKLSTTILAMLGILLIVVSFMFNMSLITLLAVQFLIALNFAIVQGNTLALAISGDENRAGAGAALYGASGFAMGAIMSLIANGLFDGTATFYVLVLGACQFGIFICVFFANKLKAKELLIGSE